MKAIKQRENIGGRFNRRFGEADIPALEEDRTAYVALQTSESRRAGPARDEGD